METKPSPDPPHADFLARAIAVSVANVAAGGGPFGAVIVRDGAVIATGANQVTTTQDPTAHAEIVAIRTACKSLGGFTLAGCVLYSSCEPCPMCLAACYWARLDAVYFAATREDAAAVGFDDAFLYHELSLPLDQRRMHTVSVTDMRAAAGEAFAIWQAEQEKTPY